MDKSKTGSLEDRVVLVTGASRGIGRAVAIAAAREGAHVVITGRTKAGLEEVDDEIRAIGRDGAGGGAGEATIVEMDMCDTPAIPRLAAAIKERWGRLDGYVANAATLSALTPIAHLDHKMWDESVAVNLTAQWHMIKWLDALLRASPGGRVVLVTSGAAQGVRPFWAPYAATKAGLEALGRSWAGESEKTDMKINLLNPGGTATGMRATAFPGEDQATLPSPADIAPAFIALLGQDCARHGELVDARQMLGLG